MVFSQLHFAFVSAKQVSVHNHSPEDVFRMQVNSVITANTVSYDVFLQKTKNKQTNKGKKQNMIASV